ncbi:MAG: CarD family transcriptional regulator [Dorea sp.]
MFKIGDYVAHYKEGVCEVTNIGKLSMSCSDKNKEYYTLKPLYNKSGTLYTPVSNEKNQIREVMSREEANTLIAEIPQIETIWVSDEKRRETFYKEALLRNQCKDWIAIIKTSYLRKMKRLASGKKSINVDEKYLNIAEKFLYGELAVALGMKKEEVRSYIVRQIEN